MPTNNLTATGKTVGSPVLAQPILRKTFYAFSLTVPFLFIGQSNLGKVLAPVGKTVGAPVLGSAALGRIIIPVSLVGARPGVEPGFLKQRHTLQATSSSIGTLFFLRPAIGENALRNLPYAQSLWIGPNVFGQPGVTQIINFIDTPQLRVLEPLYFSDPRITTVFPGGGDMRGLPAEPGKATPFYREVNAIWPDLLNQRAVISPARNGVNRETGQILQDWDHVEQSMKVIFATPFHERILRRWVGSYVPYILGETYVQRVVTRFFWAIAVSIDLWEPNYRIKQVHYMADAFQSWQPAFFDAASEIRLGHAFFRTEGVYRPRAHLGDATPYQQRAIALVGRGTEMWDPAGVPI